MVLVAASLPLSCTRGDTGHNTDFSLDEKSCATPSPISVPIEPGARQVPVIAAVPDIKGLSGLVLAARFPVRVGDEVKIVWYVPGRGELEVVKIDPGVSSRALWFGPVRHDGRGLNATGEWGTGFLFDSAGCWEIRLIRTNVAAHIWIEVLDA